MISINVENDTDIMELLSLIDISSQNPDHDTMEINYNKIVVTFGNVKKSLETLQREIEELQNSSSGSGDSITVASVQEYATDFDETDWVDLNSQKILKIPPSVHHLGTDTTLGSILKKGDDGYDYVFVTFKVLVDGTVVVYSELAFSGRLVVEQILLT